MKKKMLIMLRTLSLLDCSDVFRLLQAMLLHVLWQLFLFLFFKIFCNIKCYVVAFRFLTNAYKM